MIRRILLLFFLATADIVTAQEPIEIPPPYALAEVEDKECLKLELPRDAFKEASEGITTLAFVIDTEGKTSRGTIIQSSGSKALDNAALSGLSRCRFKPALVDGNRVTSWTALQYEWTKGFWKRNFRLIPVAEDKAANRNIRGKVFFEGVTVTGIRTSR